MKMSIKKIVLLIAVPVASAFSNAALAEQSTLCKFYSGIKTGKIVDYSNMGFTQQVGMACHDGQGGQGVIVSRYQSQGQRYIPGSRYTQARRAPAMQADAYQHPRRLNLMSAMNNQTQSIPSTLGRQVIGQHLNPELNVALNCGMATSGNPVAMAACTATVLTENELEKCQNGFGTANGCFGPNNTVRKHVENAVSDIVQGPGPSNDLARWMNGDFSIKW